MAYLCCIGGMKQKVIYKDMGRIAFNEAWDIQTDLLKSLVDRKRAVRKGTDPHSLNPLRHYLLFCEHNPVYTLGKSGTEDNLLIDTNKENIDYFKINRGGDITYHGPGQITGYPILDLDEFFTDLHKYVRLLEEAMIRCLKYYDIKGERLEGYTGVWINDPGNVIPWRKICAIGVHLSRWVTMHGFALNVNTDLSYFNHIIPCGIDEQDKTVSSIQKETGRIIDMDEVKSNLKSIFAELFDYDYEESSTIDQYIGIHR